MKTTLLGKFTGVILSILVMTGCAPIQGSINRYPIQEIYAAPERSKINLVMGEGSLNLTAGNDNMVTGTIQKRCK